MDEMCTDRVWFYTLLVINGVINECVVISTARRKALQAAVYAICHCKYRYVCPFVCPTNSGIVSKWGNADGCGLRHQV